MMNTKRINYAFLLLLLFAGLMTSCVKDDDFNTPDTAINPPEIDGDTIDISGVKALYMQEAGVSNLDGLKGSEQFTFSGTKLYMTGFVTSSDEAGNFHQELVLQDKAENPTSGVKIMIEADPLFTTFEVGRKVYVELDGFTVGFSNGVIALGIPTAGSDFVSKAPQSFKDKILRTPTKEDIVPLTMSISDFARQYDNLFIRLKNVQFPDNIALGDNAKTFAAEPGEQYDAERALETCDGETTSLITSTFADFKALKLPKGSGNMDVVLTKTFNGASYRVKLNDTSGIDFKDERCNGDETDPDDPDTDLPVVKLPFAEDFEGLTDFDSVDLEGWTNQDVSGSSRLWEARSFDGNTYAQLTAFGASGNVETWLVTPGLDLQSVNNAELTFDTKDGYYNGDPVTVYVSDDFNGNADDATWTKLENVNFSTGHANGYADNFTSSGKVSLQEYAGKIVFIGFKYEGSDSGVSTTIQLDNVSVKKTDGGDDGDDDGDDDDGDEDPNPPAEDSILAFAGGDFEDWNAFLNGLNQFGLQSYATQANGEGVDNSAALKINTSGAGGNDYVFTSLATSDLPSDYSKIQFYMKGSADKSVSINVYRNDGYYPFNLGDVSGNVTIQAAENNQYTGTINTGGDWVLVTLDLSGISDLNTSDTSGDFFALKIGKDVNYDLVFDNFVIE